MRWWWSTTSTPAAAALGAAALEHVRRRVDALDVEAAQAEGDERIAAAAAQLESGLAEALDERGVLVRVRSRSAQRLVELCHEVRVEVGGFHGPIVPRDRPVHTPT